MFQPIPPHSDNQNVWLFMEEELFTHSFSILNCQTFVHLRWAQLYVSLVFCEFGFQACYYRPSFTGSVFTSWAMLKIYGYGYGQNLGILIIWWFWPYQPWTFGNLIIFNSFHRGHLHSKRQNNWTDNSSRSILSWSSCKHNHLDAVNKTWPQILIRWHQKLISWHQFKPGTKN